MLFRSLKIWYCKRSNLGKIILISILKQRQIYDILFIVGSNLNFELCCEQKKTINGKIDKQADRHTDTNKHFPLEENNRCNTIVIVHTGCCPNIMNVRIMISSKWGQNTHQQNYRRTLWISYMLSWKFPIFQCIFNIFRYRMTVNVK